MSDYVTLLGTEDVRNAGHTIQKSAAHDMKSAVGNLDDVVFRFFQQLDGYVCRFEAAAERIEAAMKSKEAQ